MFLGGCHGNGNRFESLEFCEAACQRSGPGMASYRGKKKPGPQGSLVNICNLPRDVGEFFTSVLQTNSASSNLSLNIQGHVEVPKK